MARREEIRALEGRRKALEAIKRAALVSEKEFLNKLDENSALVLQTQTNVEKFAQVHDEESGEEDEEEKLQKIEDMAPLHKKFQKCLKDFYSDSTGYAIVDDGGEEDEEEEEEEEADDLFDIQSMPLLAEQTKDKELLKEKLENLQEKKKQVDKLIQDLNRLKEKANLADDDKDETKKDEFLKNYSIIKSELSQNQNQIDLIKTSVNTSSNANNTAIKAEKIINLLENQEKLE